MKIAIKVIFEADWQVVAEIGKCDKLPGLSVLF